MIHETNWSGQVRRGVEPGPGLILTTVSPTNCPDSALPLHNFFKYIYFHVFFFFLTSMVEKNHLLLLWSHQRPQTQARNEIRVKNRSSSLMRG